MEKGNRLCPWFPAFSSGLRVTIPIEHPHWLAEARSPSRRPSCKQFHSHQNPARHLIQPPRLHNSVRSPEVLLCIDMEKILHRRKCHISYQCLQAHVSNFKDMSQIYIHRVKCLWMWTFFNMTLFFGIFFLPHSPPSLKKGSCMRKRVRMVNSLIGAFSWDASSSPLAAASPPSTELSGLSSNQFFKLSKAIFPGSQIHIEGFLSDITNSWQASLICSLVQTDPLRPLCSLACQIGQNCTARPPKSTPKCMLKYPI